MNMGWPWLLTEFNRTFEMKHSSFQEHLETALFEAKSIDNLDSVAQLKIASPVAETYSEYVDKQIVFLIILKRKNFIQRL